MLIPSPLESKRFGLRIFRADLDSMDAAQLFAALAAHDADLAIVRLPTGVSSGIHALANHGMHALHADTLVTYECDLLRHAPAPLKAAPAAFELARPEDGAAISEMVRVVFADYPSHYAANPLLSRQGALEGYCEWALTHLDAENCLTWVMRANGKVAAFACNAFDPAARICQGVLYGVHPDFAGNGIYGDLIRHAQHHFKRLGYARMRVQTQIGNLAVQRAWIRDGFVFAKALDTFHVNALMDRQRDTIAETALCWQDSGTISHLVSAATALLDPGSSSGASACNAAMIGTPAPGSRCTLQLRRYELAQRPGHAILSATLHDADERLCGIAHFRSGAAGAGASS